VFGLNLTMRFGFWPWDWLEGLGTGGPVGRGGKLGGRVESSLALELVSVSSPPAYRSSSLSPSV